MECLQGEVFHSQIWLLPKSSWSKLHRLKPAGVTEGAVTAIAVHSGNMGGILAVNTEAQVFPWQPGGGGNGC